MPDIVLHTPLDPIAAAERLKAAVGDKLTANTPKRVTGNGTEETMTLWVHRPRVQNDFKAMLEATMRAVPDGTRIEGFLGTRRATTNFMRLWLGFVTCFLVFAVAIAILVRPPLLFTLIFGGIPLTMLIFGIALLTRPRRNVAADSAAILAFLAETINAHPIADATR